MLEVAGDDIATLSMDHHGLVASVCKDLKIAERIDARLKAEALDGNSLDKSSFHEMIKWVQEFKQQINLDGTMK
jgi:hypothetical protein